MAELSPSQGLEILRRHSPPLAKALAGRPEVEVCLFEAGRIGEPLHRPDLAAWLRNPPDLSSSQGEEDEERFWRRLRLAKEAAFTHLALRDLAGLAGLPEVLAGLSDLADLALEEAVDFGLRHFLKAKKLPAWPEGHPLPLAVLGLGKLGGRELNYASDVDLIYIHEPSLWPFAKSLPAAEFVTQWAAFVSRSLGQITAEGLVFRVDLDLRPAGKEGPLVPSLELARHHYLYRAAEWERLALLKMRPAAGNLELGQELFEETRPFVFRRHLDYTALEELRDLKAKIANRPRSVVPQGRDVKLDRGGIRQLEFFVQAFQIIFGGRNPRLRTQGTLESLQRLAGQGVIQEKEAADLAQAYVFLRRVEHRIQLLGLRQTQHLPLAQTGMDRLAQAMDYGGHTPGADFLQDFLMLTDRVAGRFDGLLGVSRPRSADPRSLTELMEALEKGETESGLDLLRRIGFKDPEQALESLKRFRAETFLPPVLSRQRQLLSQILPPLLDRVIRAADPDTALIRLERFLGRIGPKTGLYLLLLENPAVMDLLVNLLTASAFLARIMTTHPGVLDGLIDCRTNPAKDRQTLALELADYLTAFGDEEEKAARLRRFKAEETLRVAVQDLHCGLDQEKVSDQLSDLAEVCLAATVDLAGESLSHRFRPEAPGGQIEFSVLALGKLGGRELAYHSDLDVLFLYRLPQGQIRPGPPDGRRCLDPGEYAVRWAQRVISLISVTMPEGPGYEIDARLRPSGTKGPLVVSLESFVDYHRTSAVWEKLALTKARPVAGHPALSAAAIAVAHQAAYQADLPPDWVREIAAMPERMRRERSAAQGLDLKFSPGGLVEIEFLTQILQLRHGRTNLDLRQSNTLAALAALALAGVLEAPDWTVLDRTYRRLKALDHSLRLRLDYHGDGVGYAQDEIVSAGEDPAELKNSLAQVKALFHRLTEGLNHG